MTTVKNDVFIVLLHENFYLVRWKLFFGGERNYSRCWANEQIFGQWGDFLLSPSRKNLADIYVMYIINIIYIHNIIYNTYIYIYIHIYIYVYVYICIYVYIYIYIIYVNLHQDTLHSLHHSWGRTAMCSPVEPGFSALRSGPRNPQTSFNKVREIGSSRCHMIETTRARA